MPEFTEEITKLRSVEPVGVTMSVETFAEVTVGVLVVSLYRAYQYSMPQSGLGRVKLKMGH